MRHLVWTPLLAVCALLPQNANAGQFKRAVYYPAGSGPYIGVAAQFTQSGNLDLAFSDNNSGQVRVLLGNGDGTFQAPHTFSAPNAFGLAAADFNEDGNLDLAVVEATGTVVIFLGDGKGSFKLSAKYTAGAVSGRLAVADFDGDGHIDVAVTNSPFTGTGSVVTFLGDGDGKLKDRRTYKLAGRPFGIAAGDLKGDHGPDIAVTQVANGSVVALFNDGTGHFEKPVTYDAGGGEVVDVKIADLRHNGRNDLVVANGSLSAVGILLNNGDGTFGKVSLYPTHCAVEAVTVADFNLDGKLDVAVAANLDNSAFMYGKGDGTFGSPIPLQDEYGHSKDGGYSIAAGVFRNGHGPDLAIPIEFDGKVAIMINTQ